MLNQDQTGLANGFDFDEAPAFGIVTDYTDTELSNLFLSLWKNTPAHPVDEHCVVTHALSMSVQQELDMQAHMLETRKARTTIPLLLVDMMPMRDSMLPTWWSMGSLLSGLR